MLFNMFLLLDVTYLHHWALDSGPTRIIRYGYKYCKFRQNVILSARKSTLSEAYSFSFQFMSIQSSYVHATGLTKSWKLPGF